MHYKLLSQLFSTLRVKTPVTLSLWNLSPVGVLWLGMPPIDISQYRLLFEFSLLYTDRVPFELLDSAALL
jgi:hypothetical protein